MLLFFTGYVVEKSLSVDNVFVIALAFAYFGVPPLYQHRLLFWGVLGADAPARRSDPRRSGAHRTL